MDPEHRALLRAHRLDLSGQLLVSDTIVPFLYQEDILTETQVEDIESQPTNTQKSLKLLDILPSRGPRAFDAFLRSLDDFSWVRDKLLQELQTRPGPSSTDVRRLPDSVLQKVPSDRELSRLASRLGAEWEPVLMDLGLSPEALFRCRSDHGLSTHGAVLAGLVQWRRSEGKKATVQRLLQSLTAAGVHPSVLEDVLM
ncbi:death domain-containing protein CRADD [Chaetodon trifascialis]|uniref:death domain-containing protein CRADD n=1 Tax=Chaetodon trifascialis TaxID=109706 RepID=UPI0039954B56